MIKKPQHSDPSFRPLMRRLVLILCVYAPLVSVYLILLMRLVKEPLTRLFQAGSSSYAFVALLVIVIQSILLEALTSWLLRRIGLR